MKLKLFSAAFALTALGLATSGAYAQTPTPSTPAPSPTELVYLPQLPSVPSLISSAKAEGVSVVKIDQTSTEINVVYREPNGMINSVSYQVLPAGEVAGAAPAGPAPAPGTTTVVYQTQAAAPAYYYDAAYPYYDGYYPWGWYAPIGIGIGLGWHGGWGGGWHGGGWHR